MPHEPDPLRLRFADLFDNLGTDAIGYSAKAAQLSGRQVVVEGFIAHTHAHGPAPSALLLVDQPGLCPDCSPAPAAVITLQGASADAATGAHAVRVSGRLDFGFRIDDRVASFIRIEQAAVEPITA